MPETEMRPTGDRAAITARYLDGPALLERAVAGLGDGDTVLLSVGAIVLMQADHVEHHVRRIAAIRGEPGVL